jgi:transcription elongation factor Elf1
MKDSIKKKKIGTPTLINCPHCDGELELYLIPEQSRYYGTCKKCGCGFGTILVRRGEKCQK